MPAKPGRRQARPNRPDDLVVEEVPHLRILENDLWDRVKARQGAIRTDILSGRAASKAAPNAERARRPQYLFSGLLACGCCGAGYIMISAVRYGCSGARNRGTCTNRRTIARTEVEERVPAGLRDRLIHPDLVQEFVAEFQR